MEETPNLQLHIFTDMFADFDRTVLATINSGSANVIALITPLMAACFGIYVTLIMVSYWNGRAEVAPHDFFLKMAAWALILTAGMNIGYYTTYVVPFFNGLGDDLSNALLGHQGAALSTSLDQLASSYANGVLQIWQNAETVPAMLTAILMIAVVVFFGALFMAVAAAFLILAKFALALCLALGPMFISAALFPATRRFFDAWVGQCLNYGLLVALFAATAAIEINFATSHISTTFGWKALIEMALMGVVFIVVALELPSLASALAGGVGISSMVSGAVSRGVGKAGWGAAKAAGKGAASAGKWAAAKVRGGNGMEGRA